MIEDKARPGPEPERLKIEGDWEQAIGKALKKKRPKGGWPDADKDKSEKRKKDE